MPENRRILSVVVILSGLALGLGAAAGADSTPAPLSSTGGTPVSMTPGEYAIVRTMNAVRAAHGLPPLRTGRVLARAARSHSVDMARRNYFDHGDFVQLLRRFGVRMRYVGENLASGTGGLSAQAVVQMWMGSAGHRDNLLDRGFQRVGVGVAGSSRKLVTADFAGR